MRIFYLLPLLCLVLFAACGKDKETPPIQLSAKGAAAWPGMDSTITITGKAAPFTATASAPDIAGVTIDGNKLTLKALKSGTTIITITDAAGATISLPFNGLGLKATMWSYTPNDTPAETIVTSNDAAFSATLKTEVLAAIKPIYRVEFWYDTQMRYQERSPAANENGEGTYTYVNNVLTLVYNGKTVVQTVEPINYSRIKFILDETAKYQALYPDKGITQVITTRFMRRYTNPG
jgi:hypothetical protein